MDGLAAVELCPLPLELVERILSLLPVPVLCRIRTVCKVWNLLICKPAFGAQCMPQDARFVVVREQKGYNFLDTSERRWYTIKHRDSQEAFHPLWNTGNVATDGGLVFQYSYNAKAATVFVSSPIAKTSTRLPPLPVDAATAQCPRMNAVVDNTTHSYKIFVMPRRGVDGPRMVVYESTTSQWRSLTVPRRFPMWSILRGVFFHGLLYVLMAPSGTVAAQDCLWSYNHVEDVWKNTHVNLHTRPLYNFMEPPQLIVSEDRLFLASWIRPASGTSEHEFPRIETWSRAGWSYEIREVHLEGELVLSRVFEMTEAVMSQLGSVHFKAIGCCKCIVLLVCYVWSSGMSMVHDLRTSSWDLIPSSPLTPVPPRRSDQLLWHRSQAMKLIMPQWNVQH